MLTWDNAHTDIVENASIIEGDNYRRTKSLHVSLEFSRKQYMYIDGYTLVTERSERRIR
jgi:hypothetical protein